MEITREYVEHVEARSQNSDLYRITTAFFSNDRLGPTACAFQIDQGFHRIVGTNILSTPPFQAIASMTTDALKRVPPRSHVDLATSSAGLVAMMKYTGILEDSGISSHNWLLSPCDRRSLRGVRRACKSREVTWTWLGPDSLEEHEEEVFFAFVERGTNWKSRVLNGIVSRAWDADALEFEIDRADSDRRTSELDVRRFAREAYEHCQNMRAAVEELTGLPTVRSKKGSTDE